MRLSGQVPRPLCVKEGVKPRPLCVDNIFYPPAYLPLPREWQRMCVRLGLNKIPSGS